MDRASFEASLAKPTPPAGVSDLLKALWWERHGDWEKAHQIAQDIDGAAAAWVHAYLHRREGDQSNAAYWYRHAGRPVMRGDMDAEWRTIVEALLSQGSTKT